MRQWQLLLLIFIKLSTDTCCKQFFSTKKLKIFIALIYGHCEVSQSLFINQWVGYSALSKIQRSTRWSFNDYWNCWLMTMILREGCSTRRTSHLKKAKAISFMFFFLYCSSICLPSWSLAPWVCTVDLCLQFCFGDNNGYFVVQNNFVNSFSFSQGPFEHDCAVYLHQWWILFPSKNCNCTCYSVWNGLALLRFGFDLFNEVRCWALATCWAETKQKPGWASD